MIYELFSYLCKIIRKNNEKSTLFPRYSNCFDNCMWQSAPTTDW